MRKPEGVGEWDGYPMPDIPPDRKPLPKEDEDKLIAEMRERMKKLRDNRRSEEDRKIG